jgi:UDP-2,3-diacylglucosamine hydrolase
LKTTNAHKIYFISDVHLGVPTYESSLEREKQMVGWLETIRHDASDLMILGDLFDMWFDYKRVVPRGYVRLFGKLAELTDQGIKIHYFIGNHDMWVFDYFEKELGFIIYRKTETFNLHGMRMLVGHGDGLGPGDRSYKFIKHIFASKINQWFFARLHPNFALGLAAFFSKRSRAANGNFEESYQNAEDEQLIHYCRNKLKESHFDIFVFGHRHIAIDFSLSKTSRYINLGEWVKNPHYGVLDWEGFKLVKYRN